MKKYTIAALLCLTTKILLAQTNVLTMQDTRAIATTPDAYSGSLQGHFKAAAALGLSTSYYYTVLGLRGWLDDSGGKAHEFAFGDDNKVFLRSGLNNTGWGGWRSLLISNEDGNFGIGLSNFPTEKLTVNGNIKLADRASSYLIDYASLSETNSGASTILGNNIVAGTATNTVKKTRSAADAGSFVSLNYYHGITFHTGVNGELNTDRPVENSEKMRITQSGNVLIGKASQNNPAYILDVNGKARATEIVVNTTGADFVFEKDYKLQSLIEVEAFIKKNKHLPEVPTARQMVENGVSLGELNTKLLQKVEELTLHLIEKNKELNTERQRINKLEDALEKINKKLSLNK